MSEPKRVFAPTLWSLKSWLELLWKLPYKIIGGDCVDQKGPLMIRWFLTGRSGANHPCLMIHCFLRSDLDRAVHDHPWSYISIPLQSYIEHLPDGTCHTVRRFRPIFRPAEWQHWVEVTRPRTWTIIFRFRTRREWGFITQNGWIPSGVFNYEQDCE